MKDALTRRERPSALAWLPGWLSANGPGAVRPGCEASHCPVCSKKCTALESQKEGPQKLLSVLPIHFSPDEGFLSCSADPGVGLGRLELPLPEAGGGGTSVLLPQVSFSARPWHLSASLFVRDCVDTVLLRQRQDVKSNCECGIHRPCC